MQRIKKISCILYFFVCPCELVLNILIGSSAKYVGLLIFIIWIIDIFNSRDSSTINLSYKTVMPMLIWLALCIISLIWDNSSDITPEYLTTYLEMGLLVFILIQTVWSKKDIDHFLLSYFLGSIVLAIAFLLFGETSYTIRTTIVFMGVQIDPNQVAPNIIPGAVISLGYILNNSVRKRYRLISIITFLLSLYTVFMSGSRGGLVSAAGGILFVFLLQVKGLDVKKFVLLCLSVVMIWYTLRLLPSETAKRILNFDSYTDTYANGENRLTLWKALLDSFDAQWIIGHGVGSSITFYQLLMGHQQGVHNTFLLVLYEVGIIGFCFWFFPYVFMLFYNISRKNHILVGVLIAALFASFFLDALILRYIWNALILCIMKYNSEEQINQLPNQKQFCRYIRTYS